MTQVHEVLKVFPPAGIIVAALSLARLLVWLAGLAIAVRGSEPDSRSSLMHAYGASLPRILSRKAVAAADLDRPAAADRTGARSPDGPKVDAGALDELAMEAQGSADG